MSRKLKRKENFAKREAHNKALTEGEEESPVEPIEETIPSKDGVEEVPGPSGSEELRGDMDADPSTTEDAAEDNPLDVDGDGDVDSDDVLAVAKAVAAGDSAEEPLKTEREALAEQVDAMTPELLGSWSHCMSDKIEDHYGPQVASCTDGITHGNWEKILECIVTVLGIADPEIWIPEQIAYFTVWSAECIFGSDEEE